MNKMMCTSVIALIMLFLLSCEEAAIVCDDAVRVCRVEVPSFTTIPNTSFDDWKYRTVGDYYVPEPTSFWVTPNEAIDLFEGGAVVERVSGEEAYNPEGFAAKLTTRAVKEPLSDLLPIAGGALSIGAFTTELNDPNSSLKFGKPFNKRIKKVSGYYRYISVDGDSCGIYAFTRKCRQKTNECDEIYTELDTISWARFTSNAIMEEYARFELNLEYFTTETPDQVVIYFASSDDADDANGAVGSTLYIDEVTIEYE
ncbi:MAG: PCMD domain-containing protein [Bacteroidetes bacterium]|nr:PCMD domain-containing protein [Bacteroidota bacterium]